MMHMPKEMHSEKIREQIIEKAIEIISDSGFEALSVRKLSAALGYTTGVVYYYFRDKQDILDEVNKRCNLQIVQNVNNILSKGNTLKENLENVIDYIMQLAYFCGPQYAELFVFNRRSIRMKQTTWHETVLKGLEIAQDNGEINLTDDQLETLATCIQGTITGFDFLLLDDKTYGFKEAENYKTCLVDMILNGIFKK